MSAWFKCDRCGQMEQMCGPRDNTPPGWGSISASAHNGDGSDTVYLGTVNHVCGQCRRDFRDLIERWTKGFAEFMDEPRKLRGVTRNE